jgi:arabinogalactan endo-1,4-beta-galactosidase
MGDSPLGYKKSKMSVDGDKKGLVKAADLARERGIGKFLDFHHKDFWFIV